MKKEQIDRGSGQVLWIQDVNAKDLSLSAFFYVNALSAFELNFVYSLFPQDILRYISLSVLVSRSYCTT